MANSEIVGVIVCPFCMSDGQVKRNKKEKLYYSCKKCGIANLHGNGFQEFLNKKTNFLNNENEKQEEAANDKDFDQKKSVWGSFWSED